MKARNLGGSEVKVSASVCLNGQGSIHGTMKLKMDLNENGVLEIYLFIIIIVSSSSSRDV